MWMDWTYILLIPAIIFVFAAQASVKSRYSKYSKIKNRKGLTGQQAARVILDKAGLYDLPIEKVRGELSDHYDPRARALRLSADVYDSDSVAAVGIAAHECGHAIQHDEGYAALTARNAIIPAAQLGSNAAWPLFIVGLLLTSWSGEIGWLLVQIGIALFCVVLIVQTVTLPVEFNASRRAVIVLEDSGILENDELGPVRKVLSAAAMTYVAALAVTLANLVRMIVISGRRR